MSLNIKKIILSFGWIILTVLASTPLQSFYESNGKNNYLLPLIVIVVGILLIFKDRIKAGFSNRNVAFQVLNIIATFIFSAYAVIGNIFNQYGHLYPIKNKVYWIIILSIKIIAWTKIVSWFVNIIAGYYNNYQIKKISDDSKINYVKWISILLLCWLPYIILIAPAASNPDTSIQIMEVMGGSYIASLIRTVYPFGKYTIPSHPLDISNHHNFFMTLFYGGVVKGSFKLFHSTGIGLFILAIFQVTLLACVLMHTLRTLQLVGFSKKTLRIIFIIYALLPIFPTSAMYVVKNEIFATVFLLLLSMLIRATYFKKLWNNKMWITKFGCLAFILLLTQKYAIYILLFLFIVLIIFHREWWKTAIKSILIPIVVFHIGISTFLFDYLHVAKGDPIESYAIMLQQVGNTVKHHSNEIPKYDQDLINRGFKYKKMGEVYMPNLADQEKALAYKYKTVSKADVNSFKKAWVDLGLMFPDTYLEAFLHQGYQYLDITSPSWYITDYDSIADLLPLRMNVWYQEFINPGKYSHQPHRLDKYRNHLRDVFVKIQKAPVIRLVFQSSFYIWMIILIALMAIYRNGRLVNDVMVVLSPILIQIPILLIAPLDNSARYYMPLVYSFFVVLALLKFRMKD